MPDKATRLVSTLIAVLPWLATGHAAYSQTASLEAQFGPSALLARENHHAVEVFKSGEGAARVYVFLPEQPALTGSVPIIFFHHGWLGINPLNFGALIDHLVREGQVVVYPVYQQPPETSPQSVYANAVGADRAALAMIRSRGLAVDNRRVVYLGYSIGAAISLDLAISVQESGLPAPRAMVLLAPGDAPAVATGADGRSIIGDLTKLPRTLPIAVMTGAQDTSIGLPTARAIFARLCGVKPDRRVLMVLPGDSEGDTTVHARHGSPGAPDPRYNLPISDEEFPQLLVGQPEFPASPSLNQLDFYGYWKVIDAVVASLPQGALPSVVFGNGNAAQLYLGAWPDGRAYKPIQLEDPCK